MRNNHFVLLIAFLPFFVIRAGVARNIATANSRSAYYAKDSITKNGYTLIFISKDSAFSALTKQRMISTFFVVYPQEAKRFNPKTLKKIKFVVDPSYEGVAATGNGIATYNPKWLKDHPEDIDVVTHEVMHVVQAYPPNSVGWITEGIADYVRYVYGVNNLKANWALPDYKEGQSSTNSYRITARFFAWIEKNVRKSFINELDQAMRAGTYSPEIWKQKTGLTLDELWNTYTQNPALELTYR
ncbi:basic secretory protein-like protein [Hymenobacter sp. GOD-10R]|uniref:basic secretory protein-like protein n=1 Tax=Hymenobacter sp. GOD-10R TaxID=3093922 RepID=UPI002D78F9A3|nr:basic secretory protein-like protein [Hymenobacter sp. GOD-10R]WRQ28317.1 basic secretory protein-like protein [Hymenobacter sp. GOD-10R]